MNITRSAILPKKRPPVPRMKKKSFFRKAGEMVGGGAIGLLRTPGSLISGTLVGGYQGAKIGWSEDHSVTPKSVALGLISVNVVQSLAKVGFGGYLIGGVPGAVIGAGQKAVKKAGDVYMFYKGGTSTEMGESVHSALTNNIEAGGGSVVGVVKGLGVGAYSATKSGAKTGYDEGRGAVGGAFEAVREIPKEFNEALPVGGHILTKPARFLAGLVSAVAAAPAGLALGLLTSTSEPGEKTFSSTKQKLISVGATAAVGAAAGFLGGPIGAAIGGAVGAAVGLISSGSSTNLQTTLASSTKRSREDDEDYGAEVANKYRDIIQGIGVGGLSAMREGWDAVQRA